MVATHCAVNGGACILPKYTSAKSAILIIHFLDIMRAMENVIYKLSLSFRRALPERVKVFLRLGKLALTSYPPAAPIIPQKLLDDCRVLSTREVMLDHMPKNAVVGEIGTLYGDFSRLILEKCQPAALHIFDLNFDDLHDDVRNAAVVTQHLGASAERLSHFADDTFDWLYVDGDHSYKGVMADIEAAKTKIKPGGFMAFNDFARIVRTGFGTLGVQQAVSEFAVKENWKFVYFCFQGNALYEVVLKRPES